MSEAAVKKARPKHLDLAKIRLPLPGYVSILHRISGVGLFLMLWLILVLFDRSLGSPESFAHYKEIVGNPLVKLILLGLLWAYMHHFCAGIRYLLLDLHKGVELDAARLSSKIVFAVSIVLTLIIGARVLW